MDKPKPNLPTTTTFGMELPIIADLGDGWFLVAHPNGAAIATKTCMAVLSTGSHEQDDLTTVPEPVREKAVRVFEDLAWPLVRGQFYEGKD